MNTIKDNSQAPSEAGNGTGMAKIRSTHSGRLYVTVKDLSESPTVQKQIAQVKESKTYKRLVQKRLEQKKQNS
ncbi:MAG: hypothetical protein OXH57_03060 [Ekhidna sp.]|nr:hypothetical protein [Ekhidna sp.]